jgi:hypothetical protein
MHFHILVPSSLHGTHSYVVFLVCFYYAQIQFCILYSKCCFLRVSALFETRATKERVLHLRECAPKFVQYFLKRTLCLIFRIPFVNRMALDHALAKVSIELRVIRIYFRSFEIFILVLQIVYFFDRSNLE